MLELKDVCVLTSAQQAPKSLSVFFNKGELVCLYSPSHCEAHAFLEAIVGLQAVKSGYITIMGEWLTPLSAPFLRKKMCYIPLDLNASKETTAELFEQFMKASGAKKDLQIKQLLVLWRDKNIAKSHLYSVFNQLEVSIKQNILFSFLQLLTKQIVLIAVPKNINSTTSIDCLLSHAKELAMQNKLVILATNSQEVANGCDKRININ